MPQILIGCPNAVEKRYCLKQYVEGLKQLTWKDKEIFIVDNSPTSEFAEEMQKIELNVARDIRLENVKERIAHSRNIIRDKVLSEGYDYFLSLESDVIPPPDLIERMLAANVPAITGVYFTIYTVNGEPKMRPLVWKAHDDKQMTFMNEEVKAARGKKREVVPVKASGLGCMLIHRSVLEKIKFRATTESFDDMPFCQDLEKNGFTLYADLTLICKHHVERNGQVYVLPP